jgi:hypothetical protein
MMQKISKMGSAARMGLGLSLAMIGGSVSDASAQAYVQPGEQLRGARYALRIDGLRECFQVESGGERADEIEKALWSCHARDRIQDWLKVVQIGTATGALYAACTPVGTPVAIGMAGTSLGIQVIDAALTLAACDNSESERSLQAMIRQSVCEAMIRKGIECNPHEIP